MVHTIEHSSKLSVPIQKKINTTNLNTVCQFMLNGKSNLSQGKNINWGYTPRDINSSKMVD